MTRPLSDRCSSEEGPDYCCCGYGDRQRKRVIDRGLGIRDGGGYRPTQLGERWRAARGQGAKMIVSLFVRDGHFSASKRNGTAANYK